MLNRLQLIEEFPETGKNPKTASSEGQYFRLLEERAREEKKECSKNKVCCTTEGQPTPCLGWAMTCALEIVSTGGKLDWEFAINCKTRVENPLIPFRFKKG